MSGKWSIAATSPNRTRDNRYPAEHSGAVAKGKGKKTLEEKTEEKEKIKEEYNKLWQTIRAGRPYVGEFRNCRKNGTFYEAESHIYPIFNKKGEIKYYN